MKTINRAVNPGVHLNQVSGSGTTTPELTVSQKIMMVFVAVLSSFAVGSLPLIYAFTLAPTHSQNMTQSPTPRGEMF
ncbi:MAG: hypothetical protein JOZ78_15830 [Chroococcidiopsidaceae cyanobacterium CP_BM_ER_R8_30]|nr:hypothetical protein [Chroococcidiopsidaceae cyanobacterium CP_BM_ER_R8_30]